MPLRLTRLMSPRLAAVALGVFLLAGSPPALALDPVLCIDEDVFVPPPPAPAPVALGFPLPREVYEGATPPNLDPAKPVLVFVQGLHGAASDWRDDTEYYGHNDMYDAAYAAGYKTFFVDLWDAAGPARSSIANGRLLRRQIQRISWYWGVDSVNLVTHSKGGPDSNFAVMFGAPVNTLVSLSGAHWGSPLADLAQSSWFDWLAELLGYNDEGTRFLQTGCMELMRGRLDSLAYNDQLSFYTAAATGWGPLGSALEFGGLYLAAACPGGDNDGLVCVEHAKHPWARNAQGEVDGGHRLVWDAGGPYFEADHDSVRMGNAFFDFFWPWEPDDCYVPIFDSIEPYAGAFHEPLPLQGRPGALPPRRERPLLTLLRGGAVGDAGGGASFPVEGGVSKLAVRLLLSDSEVQGRLIDPSGTAHELSAVRPAVEAIFRGAWSARVDVEAPPSGDWRLELTSPGRAAFALVAVLDSALDLRLAVDSEADGRTTLTVLGEGAGDLSIDTELRRVSTDLSAPAAALARQSGGASLVVLPNRAGVHNLALTVRGMTGNGQPFERSAVASLAVEADGSVRVPEVCE